MSAMFNIRALARDPDRADFIGVSVLVDDIVWRQMNFPAKKNFADKLVCAIAGEGKGLTELRLRSLSTGRILGDWKADHLDIP